MIVTVTLNASWDITYRVDGFTPGQAHRIAGIDERAGGKGVNVARVLQALAAPVRVTGLIGGRTGAQIAQELAAAGLDADLVDTGRESRRTVTVVDGGAATLLSEPGSDRLDWAEHRAAINLNGADVVVLAGSIPPGLPTTAYRDLTEAAHAVGAQVIVDADGPALHNALEAKPELVKPNAAELQNLTGLSDPVAGAAELVARGAQAVVVSLGEHGMIAFDGVEVWQIPAVRLDPVNPTGAGDAAVAGLALGLRHGNSLPHMLQRATELAARAVLAPAAGDLGPSGLRSLPPVRTLDGAQHA